MSLLGKDAYRALQAGPGETSGNVSYYSHEKFIDTIGQSTWGQACQVMVKASSFTLHFEVLKVISLHNQNFLEIQMNVLKLSPKR